MPNAILVAGEPLIGLAEAGRPSRTHPSTVSRWIARGIRAKSGERVKLECVRAGGKLLTSAAAVARFFAALSGEPAAAAAHPVLPSPAERCRAVDRAEAELLAAGA